MVELNVFDKFALDYDRWFDTHEKEYALELKAIRELLPKDGDGIEIGAGTGRFTEPLGISLGIEPSEAMRNIALGRGANIIAGTAEYIPVKDNVYRYALLVTTVCFLANPEIAFKEVHRVLESDGYIIVGLIDKESKLGRKYEAKKAESRFYANAIFHSVEEIKKILNKTGFSYTECVQAILPGDVDNNDKREVKSEVKPGYGEGSFVVLKAQKIDA